MADVIQISPVFHERPFTVPGANPDSTLPPVKFSCDTSPFVLDALRSGTPRRFRLALHFPCCTSGTSRSSRNTGFFQWEWNLEATKGALGVLPDLGVIISRPFQRKKLGAAVAVWESGNYPDTSALSNPEFSVLPWSIPPSLQRDLHPCDHQAGFSSVQDLCVIPTF